MEKICPECGKTFECKHNADCFCTKYVLDKQTLDLLKEKYKDCICEDCLKKYSDKQ